MSNPHTDQQQCMMHVSLCGVVETATGSICAQILMFYFSSTRLYNSRSVHSILGLSQYKAAPTTSWKIRAGARMSRAYKQDRFFTR